MARHIQLLSSLVICVLLASASLAVAKSPPPAGGAPPAQKADPNAAPTGGAPKDAQYTIYCQAIPGIAHVEQANAFKGELLKLTKMSDWYVIHSEDESTIYYGYYRSIDDPKDKKETERAKRDLAKINDLVDPQSNKIFRYCFFVPITAPDPTAPPEWDLRNASGYWSVEIGVYKDSPARKQAAVDAVRDARKAGIEAYYYHGPTASSVCIGSWPREAIREQDEQTGIAHDPNQDVLVLPQPIAGMEHVEIRNREGQRVRALAPKTEIVDPSLTATLAKYPTHALNGAEVIQKAKDSVTGEMKETKDPSVVVPIPHDAPSLLRQNAPPPSLVGPATPSQQTPGSGQLRSIGQQ